jgi:hypothetical protein
MSEYHEAFDNEFGKLKGIKASLNVREGAQSIFKPARQVSYSIRPNVERELKRLEDLGIISPVESA